MSERQRYEIAANSNRWRVRFEIASDLGRNRWPFGHLRSGRCFSECQSRMQHAIKVLLEHEWHAVIPYRCCNEQTGCCSNLGCELLADALLQYFPPNDKNYFECPIPSWPKSQWPPAVETSIAVEDAVENRGLYRIFVSRLFLRGLGHYSATIARLSPLSGLERGG